MKFLRSLWARWKDIALKIGASQSRVIMTIFYFTVLLPAGIVFRCLKDELEIKKKVNSSWRINKKQAETMEEMRKQY